MREQLRVTYPRDFFTLAFVGNGLTPAEAAADPFIGNSDYGLLGERANLDGFGVDMTVWSEIGVQYARKLMEDDKLSIGFRPKLLLGAANIHTRESEIGLTTDATDYTLTGDLNFVMNTSNVDTATVTDPATYSDPGIYFKNMGFGMDLGATYDITEKFQVSASATDIGFINWKSNTRNYYLVGADTFAGVEGLEDELLGGGSDTTGIQEGIVESLTDGFSDSTDTDKYRTWLNCSL